VREASIVECLLQLLKLKIHPILKAVYGIIQARHRGVAQSGSALALGARGPGFKSRRPDNKDPNGFETIRVFNI
jgi:hypothetical protein